MNQTLQPVSCSSRPHGLLVLHGNRLEMLAEVVIQWLAANPLPGLEQETILVQSNGMGEWLKMEMARAQGVCAATRLALPAQVVWQAYRSVLGRGAVPPASPLDKLPLTWRLMSLLPRCAEEPVFAPVAGFLGQGAGDAIRRLQLAQRLADLYDQYQVYRSDWLLDWEAGRDVLRRQASQPTQEACAVPEDQRWQPALWRRLLESLKPGERGFTRVAVHQRFLAALAEAGDPSTQTFQALPRRIILFGTTHIPHQILQAIAALSRHCQVLMAVPNPCQYHWADIIDGREHMAFSRRRHAYRDQRDLSAIDLPDLDAHGHPLLAAWGRQSRDFVRQLDAFDETEAVREHFPMPRVDLFSSDPGESLLEQVQTAMRDLRPILEHPRQAPAANDRSIVFHVAHSAQREVEILHDQLLEMLAQAPQDQPLAPRDIVVMVPDMATFAPAIRSVFGAYAQADPRYIPWGITDLKERQQQPLLRLFDGVLGRPQARFSLSEVRDLLEVPAVARRFDVALDELPTWMTWIEGSGVRWGLHQAHRRSLGLDAAGDHNTWAFGLRRMLLGYATGELSTGRGYAGIEPYDEVAGPSAEDAGRLAELLQTLTGWWEDARLPRTPDAWQVRLLQLLDELFVPTDDLERAVIGALQRALEVWTQACASAQFQEVLEWPVVKEAWLSAVDEPRPNSRFRAGGVTFCTLLPLRAIPFEVVALLGMNDGDFPRRSVRLDFDLMGSTQQTRPGDRSRRDDDRQLMLDALLSARRVLYVSWVGRSQRDNQVQPPSVTVSQLRDYLSAGWSPEVLTQRTTEHPLQAFSRRYVDTPRQGLPTDLFTYADLWRSAHGHEEALPVPDLSPAEQPGAAAPNAFTLQLMADVLRNPVRTFFQHRLQVSFQDTDEPAADEEAFDIQGLARHAWMRELRLACARALRIEVGRPVPLPSPGARADADAPVPPWDAQDFLQDQVARLQRAGRLPLGGPGQQVQVGLQVAMGAMVQAWMSIQAAHPHPCEPLALRWTHPEDPDLRIEDGLEDLWAQSPGGRPVWLHWEASKVADPARKKGAAPRPRVEKLLRAWGVCLVSAALGQPVDAIIVGEGASVHLTAPEPEHAQPMLSELMRALREGLWGTSAWPTALKTGLAWLQAHASSPGDPDKAWDDAERAFEGDEHSLVPGEGQDPHLARLYPDFATLVNAGGFEEASRRLYESLRLWLEAHAKVTPFGEIDADPEDFDE